jgi:hypothetical protein
MSEYAAIVAKKNKLIKKGVIDPSKYQVKGSIGEKLVKDDAIFNTLPNNYPPHFCIVPGCGVKIKPFAHWSKIEVAETYQKHLCADHIKKAVDY